MKTSDWLLLLVALALGLAVALVDLSPGWDDTGVSAAAVFAAAAGFGATRPSRAWLWALAVGCGSRSWASWCTATSGRSSP